MADVLEDDDPSELAEHRFGYQEWDKLEENFMNSGYREGITAGKEDALQEGFDAGFAEYGAPIGRDIGTLRGVAAALLFVVYKEGRTGGATEAQRHQKVILEIVTELGKLNMTELLPPDADAIEHAKEHAHADNHDATAADADLQLEEVKRTWEHARGKIEEFRQKLNAILEDIGLSLHV